MRAKGSMRVIVLAATKGGVGKTTLASALSVRAAKDSDRVALIDADPQNSLERWWELRGSPDNPRIVPVDCSAEGLGLLIAEGWDWVVIDTPTGDIAAVAEAVSVADFVLVPCRTSAIDVEAMDQVVEVCTRLRKPFAFVLNQVQNGEAWRKLTSSSAEVLSHYGPVLDERVTFRKAFTSAMAGGRSGAEKDSEARAEIDALWESVAKHTKRKVRAK